MDLALLTLNENSKEPRKWTGVAFLLLTMYGSLFSVVRFHNTSLC